jgi:subtilisin family serine protease
LKVAGVNDLGMTAVNDRYYIGVVKESLWENSGSKAGDLNGNGSKKDNFHFVTFKTENNSEEFWVVYFDTDADGTLSDENPLRNYREKYDAFTLPNKKGLPKFTLGLNIFPEKQLISFYFDDGSHGTHCAGISAGNRIGNNELYGVAPGAYVMGIKLGNNNFAGGATVAESMKKAYLYADKISNERKEPCIINMSFGIGSEIEGQSDIEIFLEDLVSKNPYLYIATSNGNEGPGLSTSGMPSASSSIFSTGAVLSEEVGNDLYGTSLDRDILVHFSSRGGEVSKPDVVAPGACVSTVPNFSKGDRFWGTSMASPYSAGVMSLLLGAMKVEYPEVKIPSLLLYKVLRESAKPMPGYTFLDQGSGLINVESAYKLLKKYIENDELNKFETYTVTSFAPNMPRNYTRNLYIRDGSYLSGSEKFQYRIKRNNQNGDHKFYRLYNLKSDADWLKVVQKKVHIRNDQSVYVDVTYDPEILKKPGLYNAKVEAFRADKTATPEFDLLATIVVPYQFNVSNNYSLTFEDVNLIPGMHQRFFLKIPHGASNLNIHLSSDKNQFTSVRYYLHDPDGREKLYGRFDAIDDNGLKNEYFQNLNPGVYEFVVLGQFTSSDESKFDLDFEIDGVNINDNGIINDELSIVNYFAKSKSYNISGNILGFEKSYSVNMDGEEVYKIPFKLNASESKKTFDVSLSKEVFNKVTDFALMIYDKSGKAKKVGGHSYKDASITIAKNDDNQIEEYTFVMIPGFANTPSDIKISINEKTYFSNPTSIDLSYYGKETLTMYPDINYNLDCDYELPTAENSAGKNYFGEIDFKSAKTGNIEITKTIKLNN